MKLLQFVSSTIIGSVMLLQAHGQNDPTHDPYRNFVGHWSGVVKVNPTPYIPDQVELTVTESKDGKKMIWSYTFGTKGQRGYSRISRTILLNLSKQQMISQWQGDLEETIFATTGLEEFTSAGYGKFTATERGTDDSVTFELEPSTMSYRWETMKHGTKSTYSYFLFQRSEATAETTK